MIAEIRIMIRTTWVHLTSDVIIEVIALRCGLPVTSCAALYEIVIREDGYDLFIDMFQDHLDTV